MNKLITYAYFIKETDIPDNIPTSNLDNPIKWAHDQLSFQLGREFYEEIYNQGTTNPTTFTAANSALFDPYIKQFLAWTANADYRVKASVFESRTGVRVGREENSDPAGDGILNTIIKLSREKAQFYKGEMINYILQQQNLSSSNFPLFKKDCSNMKFGTGFGISGVKKISTSQRDITQRTIQNGR